MKQRSIREVAAIVLEASGKPMTAQEIYEAIVRDNLYAFQAKDPLSIVRTQLRRHSENATGPAASSRKYFRALDDGRFTILGDGSSSRTER